ncbi:mechanosensitive ion channel family protein [Paludibaculum fermentans]|uniref:mechanosensitive ion channel family protein n=1 Tax=Paludibaculum fermentans TaxID=1473598 RepID=UPI003EBDBC16
MKEITRYLIENWQLLVVPTAVFGVVMAAGIFVRRLIFNRLHAWAGRTNSHLDDTTLQSLHGPFLFWIAILGLHLATQSAEVPPKASALLAKIFLILWILSLTIVCSRLVVLVIKHKGSKLYGALPVTTLTQTLARLFVISCGALILLNTLGISITPILTALGVGGLAVALALQDTLSNLFAGFYLSIAGQVRAGDYIKLSSGEEGYVADMDWRSTTLRALANNYIVVPNAHLARAILTNYHLPETRMSLSIPVSVSYDSDPDVIEQLLVEEAKAAAGEIPGLLAEPSPFVRFIPGFGPSSLDFTLICQVAEFVDQYFVQHELRKRIFRRFRRDGILIPFPTRTLYMQEREPVLPTQGVNSHRNAASA